MTRLSDEQENSICRIPVEQTIEETTNKDTPDCKL